MSGQQGLRSGRDPARGADAARPRLDEVAGQRHLLKPGSPLVTLAARPDRASRARSPSSSGVRPAPARPRSRRRSRTARVAGSSSSPRSPPGVRDVRQVMEEARVEPRPLRRLDGAVPRRDPPLHQGPAGRAAARRRERLGHPGRGDDREPVVLGHLAAAVALAAAHARAAHRRRRRHARSTARSPTRAGSKDAVELDPDARAAIIRLASGDARRALTALEAAPRVAPPPKPPTRRASPSKPLVTDRRSSPRPSTARCCATTATATSTTTSSAPSSSRCAAPTSTPRCTTSRA